MIETGVGVREVRNYIDGRWVDGGGASFESRSRDRRSRGDRSSPTRRPVRGDRCGTADVRRHRLATTAGKERSAILYELARLLREESPRLAELVAREMGKLIRYVREREIEPAIDRILFYAGAARLIRGEVTSSAPAISSTSS